MLARPLLTSAGISSEVLIWRNRVPRTGDASLIVENPRVTLNEEHGLGVPATDAPEPELSSWAMHAKLDGDDGKQYWIDTILVGGWGADVRVLSVREGEGEVVQLPDSIYKLADFLPPTLGVRPFPRGELTAKKENGQVLVEMQDARIECKGGKTWRYRVADREKGIKIDFVHTGVGFPTWFGKEKPQAFSAHQIAYGYFWPGYVEGTLTINDREVRVKGKGGRERTYMPDSCPAESGGGHEWIWFHFDEVFGTTHMVRLSKFKDGSLYLIDEKEYVPYRTFDVEHHDWAYHRQLGAFIPTRYRVTIESDAGVMEMDSKIVGAAIWAVSGSVPDFPFALLHWDAVHGTFTYKDGRKRALTNGRAASIFRQWKPYPRIFAPEAFGLVSEVSDAPIL